MPPGLAVVQVDDVSRWRSPCAARSMRACRRLLHFGSCRARLRRELFVAEGAAVGWPELLAGQEQARRRGRGGVAGAGARRRSWRRRRLGPCADRGCHLPVKAGQAIARILDVCAAHQPLGGGLCCQSRARNRDQHQRNDGLLHRNPHSKHAASAIITSSLTISKGCHFGRPIDGAFHGQRQPGARP